MSIFDWYLPWDILWFMLWVMPCILPAILPSALPPVFRSTFCPARTLLTEIHYLHNPNPLFQIWVPYYNYLASTLQRACCISTSLFLTSPRLCTIRVWIREEWFFLWYFLLPLLCLFVCMLWAVVLLGIVSDDAGHGIYLVFDEISSVAVMSVVLSAAKPTVLFS